MGLFVDNYDDCLDKYSSCIRAGDNRGAEKAILKAFEKDHDENETGDLYYLLSLTQFDQDKNDIAYTNMENAASWGCQEAVDFIAEVNEDDEDDDMNLGEISKLAKNILVGAGALVSLLGE